MCMKALVIFFIPLVCITSLGNSQVNNPVRVIDTAITVNYGKMPPVYFSNKVYWERNYDKDNHLLFEALKYNDCFIGYFIDYWPNGSVKTRGQYLQNNTVDWTDLVKRGLCSIKDSVWKTYSDDGRLIGDYTYSKDVIIARRLP